MSESPCPVCGAEAAPGATECPDCHLAVSLFDPVRDAASMGADATPVYLRTVAELIGSVDLASPAPPVAEPAPLLRAEPPPEPVAASPSGAEGRPKVPPLRELPRLPELPRGDALRSRAHEYELLGRQMGAELVDLAARAEAAEETADEASLQAAVREMFVHLAGGLAELYDAEGARRNELAARGATAAADLELAGARRAIGDGDLTGAHRHLLEARRQLSRVEEAWATQKILFTECELLSDTIRELGGDPEPALGPLRQSRRDLDGPQRERAELLLAQTTFALWVLLEPRFTDELRRLKDRLVELRGAGADLAPALAHLRAVALELRRRNFAGTILAYRRLRDAVGRPDPVATELPSAFEAPATGARGDPSA